jgi:Arc/MetJ-type ribon-helix-helix transcriptional regulator
MPKKQVEQINVISVRVTDEMLSIIRIMARTYGNNADVLRAGIMALWREFDAPPAAGGVPDAPDA